MSEQVQEQPTYEDACDYCCGNVLSQKNCPVCKGSGRVDRVGYKASVVDWCHGMTGGVLCACNCGERWSLRSTDYDSTVFRSLREHEERHAPPAKGDGAK